MKSMTRRVIATLLLLVPVLLGVCGAARAEKWALLIGIDQYADANRINPLGAAAADAKAMATTLHEVAGFDTDHIQLLVSDGDLKPTRTNILNALGRLGDSARPGDTVFVLFSGHGVEVKGVPYLLPYDTTAFDDELLAESALEVSKFRQRLGQIHTKALILAFDMCRSSPKKGGKDVSAADSKMAGSLTRGLDFKQSPSASTANAAVTITLFSCSPDERSYEWAEKGRGYFSYFLEQGLRGKAADVAGVVTGRSLANYVGRQVKATVSRVEHFDQNPYPSLDGNGVETFVLASVASRVAAPSIAATGIPKMLNTRARLTVEANVPEAMIAVDGETVAGGTYAANLLDEPQKDVQVTISAPGYETVVMTVTLRRGKTEPLKVTLTSVNAPNNGAVPSAPVAIALTPAYFVGAAKSAARDLTCELKANALARIARAQTVAGDTGGAAQTIAEADQNIGWARDTLALKEPGSSGRAMTLTRMASAQIALGNTAQAARTLEEAKTAAGRIGDFWGKPNTLTEIAILQAKCGDAEGARKTNAQAKNILSRGGNVALKGGSLANVARSQAICGDIAGARGTIVLAKTLTCTVTDPTVNSGPLSLIAQAQAACGDIAEAKTTVEQVFNLYRKSEALCAISKAQAERGDVAGAIETASPIVDAPRKSEALVAIAVQQATGGNLRGAKATADGIIPAQRRAEALAGIAAVLARAKK